MRVTDGPALVRPPGPLPGTLAPIFTRRELERLPGPAGRYLLAVLPPGGPFVQRASFTQEGEFRMRPGPEGWRPFVATNEVRVSPPGFKWSARIGMELGLRVRVRDVLDDGHASMRARVLGVVPVASMRASPELDAGALQRYLAEAVLVPTALLPRHGVFWEALGPRCARAWLAAGTTTASLEFHFGDDGLVHSVFAPARFRSVGGRFVPTPWQGRWWGYARRDGMFVPTQGEVGWLLPQGYEAYWRGRITGHAYGDVARPS